MIAALLLAAAAPSFTIDPATVRDDAGTVNITIHKSAKASSYSQLIVTTADATAKAGTDYSPVRYVLTFGNNTLTQTIGIPILSQPGYQGDRTFTVLMTVKRFATLNGAVAPVLIKESEAPPAPPPPPPPPEPTGRWAPAPLAVGGYAWHITQGPCCNGTIVKIVGVVYDEEPAYRGKPLWQTQFYSDVSGNFPVDSAYERNVISYFNSEDLQGLAPAP